MMNTVRKSENLLPFPVISAAANGDTTAMCAILKLNFRKLSVEERKWLKKIAEKSDLLKNPKPQRGRR